MKSDENLQKDVQDALKWEPQLRAAEIGVIAKNGIVTLTGTVDNYYKKSEAENAAKKVSGVKAIVEKIEIKTPDSKSINDNYIAEKILNVFKSDFSIPDEKIKLKVEKGWVTLEGNVNWNYQKEAAKNAVIDLMGVRGVTNNIMTRTNRNDAIKKTAIEKAIHNNAALEHDHIEVSVNNNDVKLSGLVASFFEKEEAERIAWKTPGVWSVDNEIGVDSF
ncbi:MULTISPECIES: BON domain-containing protein [unclassified Flavobacterium]|uniref:BON domain-containing protein n=1 Tax=unclassified Flavobacterium TaxID=196869 RepID=UPI000EAE4752|nr:MULTISPECIES: BON domain-containing protein [unclassified Flavobacterium]RKS03602.1 osmotically-inducible protein OsmY [Flavobacterium sp. 102]